MKNTRGKTKKQWFIEWLATGLIIFLSLVVALLAVQYLSGFFQFGVLLICFMSVFILGIIFLVRTFGVIMNVVTPEKKAKDILIDTEKIELLFDEGSPEDFSWTKIQSIFLTEVFDGIYIHSEDKKQSYALPINYKSLEEKIDSVITSKQLPLKKDKTWIASNQDGLDSNKDPKNVRRVYHDYHSRGFGGPMVTIEAGHGIEVVSYSR